MAAHRRARLLAAGADADLGFPANLPVQYVEPAGLGAESFAWLIVFALLPLCCVYYPVEVLPRWLQFAALSLPPTYVFEGLRGILLQGSLDLGLMAKAFLLNIVYFAGGYAAFAHFLQSARVNGTLVQMGE